MIERAQKAFNHISPILVCFYEGKRKGWMIIMTNEHIMLNHRSIVYRLTNPFSKNKTPKGKSIRC